MDHTAMRRLLSSLSLLVGMTLPAAALEVQAEWPGLTEPATLVTLVLARDGSVLQHSAEGIGPGSVGTTRDLTPLPRQAARLQMGLVQNGRITQQSPRIAITPTDEQAMLALSAVLALGFHEDFLCDDGTGLTLRPFGDVWAMLEGRTRQLFSLLPDPEQRIWQAENGDMFEPGATGLILRRAGQEDAKRCLAIPMRPILPVTAQASDGAWQVTLDMDEVRVSLRKADADIPVDGIDGFTVSRDTTSDALVLRSTGISMVLQDIPCRMPAAEVPQPLSARLTLGDADAGNGCAGDPIDPLRDARWQVNLLLGIPLPPNTPGVPALTLEIEGEQITGRGACNRYLGRIAAEDGRLQIRDLGTTRLACPADLQSKELRFLDALEAATGFDLTQDGTLVILSGHVPVLTARRTAP
jgi:heat shock protein HslJ